MNRTIDLWSLPWHARLKDLADGFRVESAVHAASRARKVAGRRPVTVAASWLERARTRHATTLQ